MPAFGTVNRPVRTRPDHPIHVNAPDGFMTDPPGDLWWIGLYSDWHRSMPTAITRATSVLVNPLCRMPWNVVRRDGTVVAPNTDGYPAWLADPMLLNGSTSGGDQSDLPMQPMLSRLDRFDFWSRWITSALWFGLAALSFYPDSEGRPRAGTVQVLPPGHVWRGTHGWEVQTTKEFQEQTPDGPITSYRTLPIDDDGMVAGQRIVLLRHSLPGGVIGWHRTQLALSNRIGEFAAEGLDSGVPSGVLTSDMPVSQRDADHARTEWETRQQRRSLAVLGNGAKYQSVVWSPQEAEIVGMSRLSNEQIAHAFELPAWYLDASLDSGTYATSVTWRQDLVDGPLASWESRVSETLGALLPWGWRIDVDFTAYTRPTTTGTEDSDGATDPA